MPQLYTYMFSHTCMQPVRPAKEVSSTRKDAYPKDSMDLHNFFALITELSLSRSHW